MMEGTVGPRGVDPVERHVEVDGLPVRFVEAGTGRPVVFLHGNPTSSHLWRDVLPVVAPHARCLAIDLAGMGGSASPAQPLRIQDHARVVAGFIDALGLDDVTLVGHDWGTVLAIDYLGRHPDRMRGLAFMEGHIHPIDRWEDLDEGGREMFAALRSEDPGRRMVIEESFFVEVVIPSGIVRTLSDAEMAGYRAPFADPARREVIWRWVREIPIAGEPPDTAALVTANKRTLATSPVPKLLLHATPGAVIGAAEVAWCREHVPALTVVDLGEGRHFLPEDHPVAIGQAIVDWLP